MTQHRQARVSSYVPIDCLTPDETDRLVEEMFRQLLARNALDLQQVSPSPTQHQLKPHRVYLKVIDIYQF